MNQPIKSLKKAPLVEPSQIPKPRPRRRLVLTFILVLLVLAGVVWWTRQEGAPRQASGGRNAAPMSIVPATVGKGDILNFPHTFLDNKGVSVVAFLLLAYSLYYFARKPLGGQRG